MSSGTKLQDMEVDVKENAVTANAKPAEPMVKPSGAQIEDLGGPTPENYKVDDDSAKLKTPGVSLKQVKDVVNKGAKSGVKSGDVQPGTSLNSGDEVEVKDDQEIVSEDPVSTEEVVAEDDLKKKVEDAITEEPATEEEVVAESSKEDPEELNIEEDVEALLQGEELSEEFQAKAKTIFEAAINSKVAAIKEDLEKANAEKLEEELESTKTDLKERVDSYLEYVAEEWLQENQLAVDTGLKAELSESFMTGMKSLFEEHYVSIPEDKYDVLESMVNKLDDMESKLNEQIDKNVALNKRLAESASDGILSEVSEGLAITQKEKLASLAESVEFESEIDYREKLVTLRESYFPTSAPSAQRDNSENISEESSPSAKEVSGSMANYLSTLQRVTKK